MQQGDEFAKLAETNSAKNYPCIETRYRKRAFPVKVLLAVDNSDVSRRAVAFAANLLGKRSDRDVEVTVYHVVETVPEFVLAGSQQATALRELADEWAEKNRSAGERLLAEYRETLTHAGIPAPAVQTKLGQKEGRPEAGRVVAALAIIDEMQQGNYDLVVLGRRGASATIPTLLGGVAEKVAREAHGRTICIVD